MALERKPPFKIKIFKKAQDKHPTRVETRMKESEAQTLAKTIVRRRQVGLSLPGFEWKIVPPTKIPTFNGYCGPLNITNGYACYE